MELIVFDLDGTLLNKRSQISSFTQETLELLTDQNIAYTVATGRSLHSAQEILTNYSFPLPHIYSNGVIIWDPQTNNLSLDNILSLDESSKIIETVLQQKITPFISAVTEDNTHFIYHPPIQHAIEERLLNDFLRRRHVTVLPIEHMPYDVNITNISILGKGEHVDQVQQLVNTESQLIAYSGPAIEGNGLKWMDIHHSSANKGSAIELIREQFNVSKVLCFGDSDNDLSMFAIADESYAPANAHTQVKAAATSVIGHHNEDGVAHYLRERFGL